VDLKDKNNCVNHISKYKTYSISLKQNSLLVYLHVIWRELHCTSLTWLRKQGSDLYGTCA